MRYDFKGKKNSRRRIKSFVDFLDFAKDNSLWLYNGLKVEIDPTVDFNNENVLIRWVDINEGFNDKLIYTTLTEFKKDFILINA